MTQSHTRKALKRNSTTKYIRLGGTDKGSKLVPVSIDLMQESISLREQGFTLADVNRSLEELERKGLRPSDDFRAGLLFSFTEGYEESEAIQREKEMREEERRRKEKYKVRHWEDPTSRQPAIDDLSDEPTPRYLEEGRQEKEAVPPEAELDAQSAEAELDAQSAEAELDAQSAETEPESELDTQALIDEANAAIQESLRLLGKPEAELTATPQEKAETALTQAQEANSGDYRLMDDPAFLFLDSVGRLPQINLPPEEDYSYWGDLLPAAWRTEHEIGSYLAEEELPGQSNLLKEAEIDVWEKVQADGYEARAKDFIYARTEQDYNAIARQIDREQKDRQMLADSGAWGFLASFNVGLVSPVNFIPVGGAAYRTYRAGDSILRGALVTGRAGLIGSTAQEAMLQHSQLTRTYGESAVNIAASTFLSGTIGGAVSGFRFHADNLYYKGATEDAVKRVEGDLEVPPPEQGAHADPHSMEPRTLSAAETQHMDTTLAGSGGVIERTRGISALQHLLTSPFRATREIAQKLAENPFLTKANKEGGGSYQSAESAMKFWRGGLSTSLRALDDAYSSYMFGRGYKMFDRARATFTPRGGDPQNAKMTFEKFKHEVAIAMRNGDEHENEHVMEAAKAMRQHVFDPLFKDAVDLKLLPEELLDAPPATAKSYLSRIYDVDKMIAKPGKFIDTVEKWLIAQQEVKAGIQSEVVAASTRLSSALARADKLDNDLILAQRKLENAQKALAEVQRINKRAMGRALATTETAKKGEAVEKALAEKKAELEETVEIDKELVRLLKKEQKEARESVSAINNEIRKLEKDNDTISQFITKHGGLNREAFEAEGIDPAAFKVRGNVFGKVLWPKEGGMTPDDVAELLSQEGRGIDAGEALEIVNDISNGINRYLDPEVEANIANRQQAIDEIEEGGDALKREVREGLEESVALRKEIEAEEIKGRPLTATEKAKLRGRRAEIGGFQGQARRRGNYLANRISGLESKIQSTKEARDQINIRQMQDELISLAEKYPSKKTNEIRAELKAIQKKGKGSIPSKVLKNAINRIIKAETDMEPQELYARAEQIYSRIIGTPAGRLPYDAHNPTHTQGTVSDKTYSALNQREFMIPDGLIQDYLVNDIEMVARSYTRGMSADIEIQRAFGDINLTEQKKAIEEEWLDARRAAEERGASKEELQKLNREKDKNIKGIEAIRDRLRGVYALPEDPHGLMHRAGVMARSLNYLRLLGGMTISALPDPFRIGMQHGMHRLFGGLMAPLIGNLKGIKLAKAQAQEMGNVLDMVLDTRTRQLAGLDEDYSRYSKFERGVQGLSDKFGLVSLMAPWNATWKSITAMTTITRAGNAIMGKAIKKIDDEWLNWGGIGEDMRAAIKAMMEKHATKDYGTWNLNASSWEDREAYRAFANMLNMNIDHTIITPGQEIPLLFSGPFGKVWLQLRTFTAASTQKVTLAALQRRDAYVISGLMSMVGMGALSYYLKQKIADRPVSDDPRVWIKEGIDRSGVLGWFGEANTAAEKLSSGRFGMGAMMGIEPGKAIPTRMVARSMSETIAGPTFGSLADGILKVTSGTMTEDWTEQDTRALRRLMPYQNLFWFSGVVDQIEESANEWVD
jgi:predicted GIY-YIG superfamily endonuclease